MTIFPCCRCGVTPPEPKPGAPGQTGRSSAILRHKCCADGRGCKVYGWGHDPDEAFDDAIYRWNEVNAKNNPAWWPERYDYLLSTCKTRGGVPQ